MSELQKKIEDYKDKIAHIKDYISQQDESDMFGKIRIIEASREMQDYEDRIERLKKRIAGESLCEITDEQIALADYVNSHAYDDD